MSLISALLATDAEVVWDGLTVRILRPTVAHFIAAQDAESRGVWMPAWYVATHVVGVDGQTLWKSHEELRVLSAPKIIALARLIEPLYLEGLDSPALAAKPCG